MTNRNRSILWGLLAVAAVAYLWWITTGWSTNVVAQGDALVYRAGSLAWLDGHEVYTERLNLELGAGSMFFTYGPLALLLFVPLAVLPLSAAFVALAVVSWLFLLGALVLWCRALGLGRRDAWLVGLAATVVASATGPVIDHLGYGQVNSLLLLLATIDLLMPRTRLPRGVLLGLAIAIKLTPAALLLLPLLRRDWRTIIVAGATAVVGIAASWVIVPKEAGYFWFTAVRDPGRVGNLRSPANQSIRAVFERWIDGPLGGALWLGAALVVVAFVSWAVVTVLLPRGDTVGAAAVVFVLPALLSPVAWTHHWVWSLPLLVWLVDLGRRGSRGAIALAVAGFLVLTFFPITSFDPVRLIPNTPEWSAVDATMAGGYVYWVLIALLAVPWLRPTAPVELPDRSDDAAAQPVG